MPSLDSLSLYTIYLLSSSSSPGPLARALPLPIPTTQPTTLEASPSDPVSLSTFVLNRDDIPQSFSCSADSKRLVVSPLLRKLAGLSCNSVILSSSTSRSSDYPMTENMHSFSDEDLSTATTFRPALPSFTHFSPPTTPMHVFSAVAACYQAGATKVSTNTSPTNERIHLLYEDPQHTNALFSCQQLY